METVRQWNFKSSVWQPGTSKRRFNTNRLEIVLRSKVMKHFFTRLIRDEQGQDLVEYALIVAAVGLALITTVNQLSTAIVSLYSSITQGLTSIGTSGQ